MEQSVFDPQTFAQMTFTGPNSTESTPVPVGDWPSTIDSQAIEVWSNKEKTKSGLKLKLMMKFDDPAIEQVTGRPENKIKYEIMLDLTPEGGLDMGKGMNVRLGRLREACGLNAPGQPFAFDMLVGQRVTASVSHEVYKDGLIANVTGVAKS